MVDTSDPFAIPSLDPTSNTFDDNLPDDIYDIDSIEASIASVPTAVSQPIDIINFATKDDNGESTMMSTRAPMSWAAIINDMLQDPAVPFGSVLKTRSDFLRWALWRGMKTAQSYRESIREEQPDDPIAAAHIFSEHTMGMINARTSLINKIHNDVTQLGNALQQVIDVGEPAEAASLINYYMNGVANQTDSFWRAMFTKALFSNPTIRSLIIQFIQEGLTQDTSLIDYAASQGWVDEIYLAQSGDEPDDNNHIDHNPQD